MADPVTTDPAPEVPATAPAPGASADDLISELATDDLDRMLSAAEVDRAPEAGPAPAPPTIVHAQSVPVAEPIPNKEPQKSQSEVDDIVAQALAATPEDMAELDSLPSHPEALPTEPVPASASVAEETADAPASPDAQPEQKIAPSNAENLYRFLLFPLGWLSWPCRAIPEPLLNALGKVAILTLINAAGILIYVHHFRRK